MRMATPGTPGGKGVDKNRENALYWYGKAARLGDLTRRPLEAY